MSTWKVKKKKMGFIEIEQTVGVLIDSFLESITQIEIE